jgi:hypothetical protein
MQDRRFRTWIVSRWIAVAEKCARKTFKGFRPVPHLADIIHQVAAGDPAPQAEVVVVAVLVHPQVEVVADQGQVVEAGEDDLESL